jgi:hypothetical protein
LGRALQSADHGIKHKGRIAPIERRAMWRGAFAFEPQAVGYHGRVGDSAFQAHFALQLVQGTDTPVSVVTPDGVVSDPIALIGSLVPHRLERNEDAIIRWIEPSSAEGRALAAGQTAPVMILEALADPRPALALEAAVHAAIGHVVAGPRSFLQLELESDPGRRDG